MLAERSSPVPKAHQSLSTPQSSFLGNRKFSPREEDSFYSKEGLIATGRDVMDDLAAGMDNDYFVG